MINKTERAELRTGQAQEIIPVPKVIYDRQLFDPGIEYSIFVDPEKAGKLLESIGFGPRQIADTTVLVRRRPLIPRGGELGGYSPFLDRIEVFTDTFWAVQKRHEKNIKDALLGYQKSKTEIHKELELSILGHYTDIHPDDLTDERISEVTQERSRLLTNGVLRHELWHKRDFTDPKFKPTAWLLYFARRAAEVRADQVVFDKIARRTNSVVGALASALAQKAFGVILHEVDPLERRARKFHSVHDANPEFSDIVQLAPKSKDP